MAEKYDPNADIKRGYASAPRSVFTGTPEDYETHILKAGDKIPKGAKSRPWFLGRPDKPAEPAKKLLPFTHRGQPGIGVPS